MQIHFERSSLTGCVMTEKPGLKIAVFLPWLKYLRVGGAYKAFPLYLTD
jgi:hypothetical protein